MGANEAQFMESLMDRGADDRFVEVILGKNVRSLTLLSVRSVNPVMSCHGRMKLGVQKMT